MKQLAVFAVGLFMLVGWRQPSAAMSESASYVTDASATSATMSREEQGLSTPASFLTAIYKHYLSTDTPFTTLNENAPSFYEPGMLALMAEDARFNEGSVGAIEADPICRCQDWSSISADIRVLRGTAATASVRVVITDTGVSYTKRETLTYELVKVEGSWRIRDIVASDKSSLRQDLIRSNAFYAKPAS